MFGIQKRLVGGFAEAEPSGMRAIVVVFSDPLIHIYLKLIDRGVELFSKKNGIALVLHGSMKTFANAIGLRMISINLGMTSLPYRISYPEWTHGGPITWRRR